MLLIPILRDSRVGEPLQCRGRGRAQIGRQYRFPYHEHAYTRVLLFSEQFVECRGPLQANRSSRGEQNQHSNRVHGPVKRIAKRCDIGRIQANHRLLPAWNHASTIEIVEGQECYRCQTRKDDPLAFHDNLQIDSLKNLISTGSKIGDKVCNGSREQNRRHHDNR